MKLFRLENTFKIPSPHTVFCVFLGNEIRLIIFLILFLSEMCFIFSFLALTLAKKLLEKSWPGTGLSTPIPPPGHTDQFNVVNKNPSLPVLHVFFPRVLGHIFMSIRAVGCDTLVSLSLRFCSGLPGSLLAAHEMAEQTFSALTVPTGWALGRAISRQLLTYTMAHRCKDQVTISAFVPCYSLFPQVLFA